MSQWDVETITRCFVSLAENDEICVYSEADSGGSCQASDDGEVRLRGPHIASSLGAGPVPTAMYRYRFAPAGIERWNAYFQPDWERYTHASHYDYANGEMGAVVVCGSQHQRERVLEAWVSLYDCDRQFGLQRIKVGLRRPWQATYWHELPEGHFAAFRCRHDLESDEVVCGYCESVKAFKEVFSWVRELD